MNNIIVTLRFQILLTIQYHSLIDWWCLNGPFRQLSGRNVLYCMLSFLFHIMKSKHFYVLFDHTIPLSLIFAFDALLTLSTYTSPDWLRMKTKLWSQLFWGLMFLIQFYIILLERTFTITYVCYRFLEYYMKQLEWKYVITIKNRVTRLVWILFP